MVGWHPWLNGHEFERALGVGDGQGDLVCYSPWGRKESDTTERLNNNNNKSYRMWQYVIIIFDLIIMKVSLVSLHRELASNKNPENSESLMRNQKWKIAGILSYVADVPGGLLCAGHCFMTLQMLTFDPTTQEHHYRSFTEEPGGPERLSICSKVIKGRVKEPSQFKWKIILKSFQNLFLKKDYIL